MPRVFLPVVVKLVLPVTNLDLEYATLVRGFGPAQCIVIRK